MSNIKTFTQIAMTWMATSCIAVAAPTVSLTQPLDQQMQEAIAADNAGKVAYMLRELGFDPNFYLPNGDTPLVFAIRMDATVSVNEVLLKSYKINVKVPTIRGETPLMLAAIKGDKALAQKLLDMGAPINADYGWTALHYSASTGKHEMTQFLIDKGAKVNARTERGVTPLYMAARIVAAPTVEVLLRAGADKTLCNDQGISPEAITRKRGNSVLADKLHIDQCAPWPPVDNEAEKEKPETTSTDDATVEENLTQAPEKTEDAQLQASSTQESSSSESAVPASTSSQEATSNVATQPSEESVPEPGPDAGAANAPAQTTDEVEKKSAADATKPEPKKPETEPKSSQDAKSEASGPLFGPLGHQTAFNPAAHQGGTK